MKTLIISTLILLLAGCGSSNSADTSATSSTSTGQQLFVQGFGADLGAARSLRVSRQGAVVSQTPLAPTGGTQTVPLPSGGTDPLTVELLDDQGQTLSHTVAGPQSNVDMRLFHNGPPISGTGPYEADWNLIADGPVFLAPELTETLWQTAVAPFGPFDTIGVHRLRAPGVTPNGKVVVFCPGAQANGLLYTNREDYDFRLYLAHRGYEVYSLDYRTHFIPPLGLGDDLQPLDLSSLNNWDGSRYVSDLHLAVELARETSRASRVYLAAFSSGNEFMYYYAALFGREKLLGLIGLDGGPWQVGAGASVPLQSVDFARGQAALQGGDTPANRALLTGWNIPPGPGPQFAAGEMIPDLSTLKPDDKSPDLLTYILQNIWGYGELTNIENGYNTLDQLLPFMLLGTDGSWPNIQTLEDVSYSNWNGKPPTLHYLDRFSQVDLPMIIFGSSELKTFDNTQIDWKFLAPTLCRTTDFETHLLQGFGHLDLLTGSYARQQVFVPIEQWLSRH